MAKKKKKNDGPFEMTAEAVYTLNVVMNLTIKPTPPAQLIPEITAAIQKKQGKETVLEGTAKGHVKVMGIEFRYKIWMNEISGRKLEWGKWEAE